MSSKPVLSVIMPVYNTAKCLKRSVNSVLTQSFKDFELIMVDDGSKDNSLAICRELAASDPRIKVFTQENGGPAKARNTAFAAMQGEYVMFVDSDDWLEADAFDVMMKAVQGHDLAIAHFYFDLGSSSTEKGLVNGDCVMDQEQFLTELMARPGSFYYSVLWNKIYRAEIIRDLDLSFDPFLNWGEDFAFNVQYHRGVNSVAFVSKPIYHYIKNVGGASIKPLIHVIHSCRIKARLYRYYKALYVESGLFSSHRMKIRSYIFNVTLSE